MPPLIFYRVQHDRSRVEYSPDIGFTAEGPLSPDIGFTAEGPLAGNPSSSRLRRNLDEDLVNEFKAHCNKHHIPTALISICSSPDLALERADQEERNGRTGVRIYKIYAGYNTYRGGSQQGRWNRHVDAFDARKFAKQVQNKYKEKVIEEWNWEYLEEEYLVLNRIPRAAVALVSWNVREFEQCMYIS